MSRVSVAGISAALKPNKTRKQHFALFKKYVVAYQTAQAVLSQEGSRRNRPSINFWGEPKLEVAF
eukprot:4087095-Amphidinium_carterae.2